MSEVVISELTNIPSHWKVSNMVNETEFITDYVANGSFASLAENVRYKSEPDYAILIRLTDFNNNYKGDFVYVDKNAYDFLKKSKLEGGEIIISNVGAYAGTVFLAPKLYRPMTLGPNSIMMNFISGNMFYYYWLKSPMGKFLLDGIISGSAQPKFNKTTFRQMQVPVPPLSEQNSIASILSSLDDKIDLLHRQNATLEKMAETLFRQWFIEEAKEDWDVKPLGSLVTVKRGSSPRPIQDYLSDTGLRWLKISDATKENSPYIFEIKEYIKIEGLNKTTHLKAGTLVLSNSATPGIPKILLVDSCIHDGWLHFPKSHFSNEFLYLLFKKIRPELLQQGNGSIFTNLKTDILKEYRIPIPDKESLLFFDNKVKQVFEKILNNTTQIRTLTALRDVLLPKLMSGEVRVDQD